MMSNEWFSAQNVIGAISAISAFFSYLAARNSAKAGNRQAQEALNQNKIVLLEAKLDIYRTLRETLYVMIKRDPMTYDDDELFYPMKTQVYLSEFYFSQETFEKLTLVTHKLADLTFALNTEPKTLLDGNVDPEFKNKIHNLAQKIRFDLVSCFTDMRKEMNLNEFKQTMPIITKFKQFYERQTASRF